jgi:hypothetical protein
MTTAVQERFPARILYEFEVGTILYDFGETTLWIHMGVNIGDLR